MSKTVILVILLVALLGLTVEIVTQIVIRIAADHILPGIVKISYSIFVLTACRIAGLIKIDCNIVRITQ